MSERVFVDNGGDCPENRAQNVRGEWVPAIPEPLFVGWRLKRCRCDCGETRPNRRSYREHYALAHIMALS